MSALRQAARRGGSPFALAFHRARSTSLPLMTSSSVLPYPAPVVTLTQREALRPQSCRIVAAPLDVPLNPAAHRVSGPVPCINHFVAGRGRPDALLLHVLRSFRVVSCHQCPQFKSC